jgi:hypothetical protein
LCLFGFYSSSSWLLCRFTMTANGSQLCPVRVFEDTILFLNQI